MVTHVLVPIDLSDAADVALTAAVELFGPGAAYTLLHVVPIPPQAATVPTVWAYPNAEDLKALEGRVAALAAKHGLSSATVQVAVSEDIGVAILRAAEETHAGVIAMPTHARGGLKRAVLGSVTDYVTRHAPCAVLTVRGYQ